MRTTVTLDPDVAEGIQRRMAREKAAFEEALNATLRKGLEHSEPVPPLPPFRVQPMEFHFKPGVDLNKLGQLLDELEAEEFLRKNPAYREREA